MKPMNALSHWPAMIAPVERFRASNPRECTTYRWLPSTVCLLLALTPGLPLQAETVYVTLEKDNALAVVDGQRGILQKTVKIGKRPRGLAASQDGRLLYVATSDDDTLVVVDRASLKVLARLPSGEDPETFALSVDERRMFVSNEDDNQITVVDLATRQSIRQIPVGVEPEGIATSPDGQWLISTSETTNMAHWIRLPELTVVDNTLVDPRPRACVFTADSQQLWISSEMAGNVSILDVATRQIIKKLDFRIPGVTAEKIQPVGMMIDRNRRYAYVALGPANRVAVIDAQKLVVVDYILVGQRVWNLAFSPDGKALYTTNGLSNDITRIDLDSHKAVKSIAVGQSPWGVVVLP